MRGAQWALTIAGRVLVSILVPLIAFVDPLAGLPVPAPERRAQGRHRRGRRRLGRGRRRRSSTGSMNWFIERLPDAGRLADPAVPVRRPGHRDPDLVPGPADPPDALDQPVQRRQLDVRRARQLHLDLRRTRRCSRSSATTCCGWSSGTTLVVGLGLLIAVLADRSRFESLAKAIIFMPMAISFVGAGIIWNFIYEVAPGRATRRSACSTRS